MEIALGPKGAFQNGNIGRLTRRVPADRVINALPARARNRKPPMRSRTPRVVELLRKAVEWQALLDTGEVANQAAIARREGITRARVTQVMGLLRLSPEIQEHILSLSDTVHRAAITERALRSIAQLENSTKQGTKFLEREYRCLRTICTPDEKTLPESQKTATGTHRQSRIFQEF